MNRTLMERAWSMLSSAKLDQCLWAEAVSTCYLINRSPSSSIEDKTPYEMWLGRKPSVAHLRIFGCEAFVHVPNEKRSKLDPKEHKCIFIGYGENVKAYNLWNPLTQKITLSRDVIFREFRSYSGEEQPKEKDTSQTVNFEIITEKHEDAHVEEQLDGLDEESSQSSKMDAHDEHIEEQEEPSLRRSIRQQNPVDRYSPPNFHCIFSLMSTNDEPRSYREALSSDEKKLWSQAMHDEMVSLDTCDTWDLESFPKGRKVIGCKWIFKKKIGAYCNLKRYKARLVSKGYSQRKGVDFNEIFSLVAELTSIRFFLSIIVSYDFEIEKMDVKTTFLHGNLDEEIYTRQPDGFVVKGKEELVCRLKRSLYGLKRSPKMWHQKFDAFALKIGYVRSEEDHFFYIKCIDDQLLIIILYVDDMFIGNNKVMIK